MNNDRRKVNTKHSVSPPRDWSLESGTKREGEEPKSLSEWVTTILNEYKNQIDNLQKTNF